MASPNELESTLGQYELEERSMRYWLKKLMRGLSSDEEDWVPVSIKNLFPALKNVLDYRFNKDLSCAREVITQFTFTDVEPGEEIDFVPIKNTPFALLTINKSFFTNLSEEDQQDGLVWGASHVFDFINSTYHEDKSSVRALGYTHHLKTAREEINSGTQT